MSFWDSLSDFGEGAWESVSAGAQEALGDWASNSGSSTPDNTQSNVTTTTAAPAAGQGGFTLGTRELLIGGGFLFLTAIIALR